MLKYVGLGLGLALAASPAAAEQSYKVFLGGHQLGWLQFSPGTTAELRSLFDSTPLGVFDGGYEGRSRNTGDQATQYEGISTATKKSRAVEIISDREGRVADVTITPEKDRTALSNPMEVPQGVLDPVAGFGRLVSGSTCPEAFKLYDGRRVIQVSPGKSSTSGTVTTCWMDYRVILGPGHLSPLYIKSIDIKMEFDPSKANIGPQLLSLRSGLFAVEFRRD